MPVGFSVLLVVLVVVVLVIVVVLVVAGTLSTFNGVFSACSLLATFKLAAGAAVFALFT